MLDYNQSRRFVDAVIVGQQLRKKGLSFAELRAEIGYLPPDEQRSAARGYRGHVEYPEYCGSGGHLWSLPGASARRAA